MQSFNSLTKLLIAAGLASALAACGGGDDTAATPSANANTNEGTPVAEVVESAAPASRVLRNPSPKAQVVRLYSLFGLNLDPGGLDYWSREPFSLETVAHQVLTAAQNAPGSHVEWMGTSTDTQFITKVYGFIGLAPDNEGLQYWLGDIARNGRGAMVAHFINALVQYTGTNPAAVARQEALRQASSATIGRLMAGLTADAQRSNKELTARRDQLADQKPHNF